MLLVGPELRKRLERAGNWHYSDWMDQGRGRTAFLVFWLCWMAARWSTWRWINDGWGNREYFVFSLSFDLLVLVLNVIAAWGYPKWRVRSRQLAKDWQAQLAAHYCEVLLPGGLLQAVLADDLPEPLSRLIMPRQGRGGAAQRQPQLLPNASRRIRGLVARYQDCCALYDLAPYPAEFIAYAQAHSKEWLRLYPLCRAQLELSIAAALGELEPPGA